MPVTEIGTPWTEFTCCDVTFSVITFRIILRRKFLKDTSYVNIGNFANPKPPFPISVVLHLRWSQSNKKLKTAPWDSFSEKRPSFLYTPSPLPLVFLKLTLTMCISRTKYIAEAAAVFCKASRALLAGAFVGLLKSIAYIGYWCLQYVVEGEKEPQNGFRYRRMDSMYTIFCCDIAQMLEEEQLSVQKTYLGHKSLLSRASSFMQSLITFVKGFLCCH